MGGRGETRFYTGIYVLPEIKNLVRTNQISRLNTLCTIRCYTAPAHNFTFRTSDKGPSEIQGLPLYKGHLFQPHAQYFSSSGLFH